MSNLNNQVLQDFHLSLDDAVHCNDSVEMLSAKLEKALEYTELCDLKNILSKEGMSKYETYSLGKTALTRTVENIMRELLAKKR